MGDDKRDDAARRFEEAASAVLRAPKKDVERELARERKARERRRKRASGKARG
jgi:hypothetical protein